MNKSWHYLVYYPAICEEELMKCRVPVDFETRVAAKQSTAQVYIQEWQTLGRESENSSGLYTGVADTRPRIREQLRFIYRSGRHSAVNQRRAQVYIQEWQTLGHASENSPDLYTGVADTRPRIREQLRATYTRCSDNDSSQPNFSLSPQPSRSLAMTAVSLTSLSVHSPADHWQ
jgi:hypothetical protein